ncbi:MAG: molybdopterin molybdotransferase MoeA [Parvibaculaceae bacterium]|nr:molybdopterin molybdotransferase MoeA [Parvibaculaceae bacterium]
MSKPLRDPTPSSTDCSCDDDLLAQGFLSVEAAQKIACSLVQPVGHIELVDLSHTVGRVVADDICAPLEMPFFDNSAMDGFAVRCCDFSAHGPWTFLIGEEIAAGIKEMRVAEPAVPTAWPIYTGAPVPPHCDAVVMQEKCERQADYVVMKQRPVWGDNIRRKGEDIARGTILISAGTKISPRHVGLLAANGFREVAVTRKPRVAILSTGDELIVPGAPLRVGQIYDSNQPMLAALLQQDGAELVNIGRAPDNLEETRALIEACSKDCDLIVSSGAVSVGGRDFLKDAFTCAGGEIAGWRVAIKPGKPVLFGSIKEMGFTGLPGNPLATFIGYKFFVAPQIRVLSGAGAQVLHRRRGVAAFDWHRKTGRTEYYPVAVTGINEDGSASLSRLGRGGSASLFHFCHADGVAVAPASLEAVEHGDAVFWHPYNDAIE